MDADEYTVRYIQILADITRMADRMPVHSAHREFMAALALRVDFILDAVNELRAAPVADMDKTDLRTALRIAAKWFREYETIHRAKESEGGYPGAKDKAERNGRRAEYLEKIIEWSLRREPIVEGAASQTPGQPHAPVPVFPPASAVDLDLARAEGPSLCPEPVKWVLEYHCQHEDGTPYTFLGIIAHDSEEDAMKAAVAESHKITLVKLYRETRSV